MASVVVDIQKFEKNSQGNVEYFIKVTFNGREWAIRKRYSDFVKLDKYLRKEGYELEVDMPVKAWWWRKSKSLLQQRLKDLQHYLMVLLSSTMSTDNSLVREFLEERKTRTVEPTKYVHAQQLADELRGKHRRL